MNGLSAGFPRPVASLPNRDLDLRTVTAARWPAFGEGQTRSTLREVCLRPAGMRDRDDERIRVTPLHCEACSADGVGFRTGDFRPSTRSPPDRRFVRAFRYFLHRALTQGLSDAAKVRQPYCSGTRHGVRICVWRRTFHALYDRATQAPRAVHTLPRSPGLC